MKYIYFSAILLAGLLVLMSSCAHEHGEDSHAHGDATHAPHGPELEPFAFTIWTKKSELFVEFPPLIVDKKSRFAAHFSKKSNFKAIEEGRAMVRLMEGNQKIAEHGVSKPSSPGIFRPTLSPTKAGTYDLQFLLFTDNFNDTITIKNMEVYPNEEAAMAANPAQPEGDEVSFLKEQAWKVDFAIEQVNRQAIREVIHTSGEIQPIKGEAKMVVAKSSGIVFFKSKNLQEGRNVRSGESLFNINSKGLIKSDLAEKFQTTKARVEQTKSDFERAEGLLEQQIIGQKEYEQRKLNYSVATAEFQTLTNNYSANGQSVSAPMAGIVKNVLVTDGQFVEEGTPLLEITRNRRLLLQGEVSQQYIPKLASIKSANFKTPYLPETQSITAYNGRLVSYGKMLESGSSFVPVIFELDNLGALIPGSFVELFLLTQPINNALAVPKSALMQDYRLNYVYVQTGGESFEKREVKLGVDDGVNVQILSGISEGEWVVTKGAYQIKMASMSSTIPAHGHEH